MSAQGGGGQHSEDLVQFIKGLTPTKLQESKEIIFDRIREMSVEDKIELAWNILSFSKEAQDSVADFILKSFPSELELFDYISSVHEQNRYPFYGILHGPKCAKVLLDTIFRFPASYISTATGIILFDKCDPMRFRCAQIFKMMGRSPQDLVKTLGDAFALLILSKLEMHNRQTQRGQVIDESEIEKAVLPLLSGLVVDWNEVFNVLSMTQSSEYLSRVAHEDMDNVDRLYSFFLNSIQSRLADLDFAVIDVELLSKVWDRMNLECQKILWESYASRHFDQILQQYGSGTKLRFFLPLVDGERRTALFDSTESDWQDTIFDFNTLAAVLRFLPDEVLQLRLQSLIESILKNVSEFQDFFLVFKELSPGLKRTVYRQFGDKINIYWRDLNEYLLLLRSMDCDEDRLDLIEKKKSNLKYVFSDCFSNYTLTDVCDFLRYCSLQQAQELLNIHNLRLKFKHHPRVRAHEQYAFNETISKFMLLPDLAIQGYLWSHFRSIFRKALDLDQFVASFKALPEDDDKKSLAKFLAEKVSCDLSQDFQGDLSWAIRLVYEDSGFFEAMRPVLSRVYGQISDPIEFMTDFPWRPFSLLCQVESFREAMKQSTENPAVLNRILSLDSLWDERPFTSKQYELLHQLKDHFVPILLQNDKLGQHFYGSLYFNVFHSFVLHQDSLYNICSSIDSSEFSRDFLRQILTDYMDVIVRYIDKEVVLVACLNYLPEEKLVEFINAIQKKLPRLVKNPASLLYILSCCKAETRELDISGNLLSSREQALRSIGSKLGALPHFSPRDMRYFIDQCSSTAQIQFFVALGRHKLGPWIKMASKVGHDLSLVRNALLEAYILIRSDEGTVHSQIGFSIFRDGQIAKQEKINFACKLLAGKSVDISQQPEGLLKGLLGLIIQSACPEQLGLGGGKAPGK